MTTLPSVAFSSNPIGVAARRAAAPASGIGVFQASTNMPPKTPSAVDPGPHTFVIRRVGHVKATADIERRNLEMKVTAHRPEHVLAYAKTIGWEVEGRMNYFRGPPRPLSEGIDVVLGEQGQVLVGPDRERFWLSPVKGTPVRDLVAATGYTGLTGLVDERAGGVIAYVLLAHAGELTDVLNDDDLDGRTEPTLPSKVSGDVLARLLESVRARTKMGAADQAAYLLNRGWEQQGFRFRDPGTTDTGYLPGLAVQQQLERDLAAVEQLMTKGNDG